MPEPTPARGSRSWWLALAQATEAIAVDLAQMAADDPLTAEQMQRVDALLAEMGILSTNPTSILATGMTLANAADALLDAVIWSPDVSMKSRKVTPLIGRLNEASTAWQKLTDPNWPRKCHDNTKEADRCATRNPS